MTSDAKNLPPWQKLFGQFGRKAVRASEQAGVVAEKDNSDKDRASGFLTGAAALDDYFFPQELTGGACPYVPGQEREIAWHAAAEACDTERVHLIWSIDQDRIWYLAARSSEFASKPHSWCPFGSLLPGKAGARPAPVCYVHYTDEAAVMMTITDDGLQIHRGTTSVVRAKAERTALGGTPVLTLEPDMITKLTPTAWHSISLLEDRMRRSLTALLVLSGLALASLAFIVWLVAAMVIMNDEVRFDEVQIRSQQKTTELLSMAEQSRSSLIRGQITQLAELNDKLIALGGWLKFYQIKDGRTRWRALVPPSVTGDRINDLGGKMLTTQERGILIGTDNDPVIKK
jgi:hypothetical protein